MRFIPLDRLSCSEFHCRLATVSVKQIGTFDFKMLTKSASMRDWLRGDIRLAENGQTGKNLTRNKLAQQIVDCQATDGRAEIAQSNSSASARLRIIGKRERYGHSPANETGIIRNFAAIVSPRYEYLPQSVRGAPHIAAVLSQPIIANIFVEQDRQQSVRE